MAQAANTNAVNTPAAPAGAVGDDCTHVGFWSAATGGSFLGRQAISTNPDALTLGERYTFPAGSLVITQPAGTNETEAMAQRAAGGKVAGGVWISYHTGDPGTTGADNTITELGRVSVPAADWTIT